MNVFLFWLIIIILFFAILPAAAISLITVVRFFYRKIRKRKTIPLSRLAIAGIVAVICLAVIPPMTFAVAESTMKDVVLTGDIAYMSIDKDNPNIRYIDYNGRKYQELDTSISDNEYFDYSEDAGLEYGGPIANVIYRDQSPVAKYVYFVFRYPVDSQLIFSVKNEGMSDCISLDETSLFCDTDTIDKRLAYYRDAGNYNYYIIDYNTDEYYDIAVDDASIKEINSLSIQKNEYENSVTEISAAEAIPDVEALEVESDYDMITILGESKDKLMLREIGEVYIDKEGRMYQLIEEIDNNDGTVTLLVLPVSDTTTKKITTALENTGVI